MPTTTWHSGAHWGSTGRKSKAKPRRQVYSCGNQPLALWAWRMTNVVNLTLRKRHEKWCYIGGSAPIFLAGRLNRGNSQMCFDEWGIPAVRPWVASIVPAPDSYWQNHFVYVLFSASFVVRILGGHGTCVIQRSFYSLPTPICPFTCFFVLLWPCHHASHKKENQTKIYLGEAYLSLLSLKGSGRSSQRESHSYWA